MDVAHEPEIVLGVFAAMANTGAALTPASEERIADAIPLLSANLEEGPGLWLQLSAILTGERAATEAGGPGSFAPALLDALAALDPEENALHVRHDAAP